MENFTKLLMNQYILNFFRAFLCIIVYEVVVYEFDARITNCQITF